MPANHADDGFAWLDDALQAAPQAPHKSPSAGQLRATGWATPSNEPMSWRRRLLSLAVAALGGRRSFIRACIALSEALTADLHAALGR